MKRTVAFCFLMNGLLQAGAAQDSTRQLQITGYVEAYYSYDLNRPTSGVRPFTYSYNRNNEINLNLGFVKAAFLNKNTRANLALMSGTYASANLASEPDVFRNVFEANAGVKVSRSRDLWVDAGIFPSHIGFESAIGKDCWNLTRSILADNTPYYEAGAKISYTTPDSRWFLSGAVLNGWQRIQRVAGNSLPSFGTQVTYKPMASLTLNSSTFIGTDKPDSAREIRYFHNFYGIWQIADRTGLIFGLDYGLEGRALRERSFNSWYSSVAILRVKVTPKTTVAARAEYYVDKHNVIVVVSPGGFRTSGVSANLDYAINDNALWRIEVRHFRSRDPVFETSSGFSSLTTFVTTSLAVSF